MSTLRIGFVVGPKRDYARNDTARLAMQHLGHDVIVIAGDARSRVERWTELARRMLRGDVDLVYVAYPGYATMPMVWLLARLRRRPVVFDAFLSLYETRVVDRKEVSTRSFRALAYRLVEWLGCHAADCVVVDTPLTADYLAARTGRRREDFFPVLVGSNEQVMRPCTGTRGADPRSGPVRVVFYGTYSPLQGPDVIVDAAAMLERLEPGAFVFELVGDGPLRAAVERRASGAGLTSVSFVDPVPLTELRERLCGADVALGVFGTSDKTQRVIPNKVFDAFAVGRPLVTARADALAPLVHHDEHALLVPPGDPDALAQALRRLKESRALRDRLGAAGRALFESQLSTARVSTDVEAALAHAVLRCRAS